MKSLLVMALIITGCLGSMAEVTGQVIFDGDSLTVGAGVIPADGYVSQAMILLGPAWMKVNVAVGGQTTAAMIADAATQVDTKYRADLEHNVVVIWGGTNDLYFNATADDVYNRLVEYCQGRRAAGFKVVIVTILPRAAVSQAIFNASRQAVNERIRQNWRDFADALADVAADTRIGDAGDELNKTYYVDKCHMTKAGYAIVAGIVVEAILDAATNEYYFPVILEDGMAGVPPLKNIAFSFEVSLVSQTDTDIFQTNPTLAIGDVKVSQDGGGLSNITTLPVAIAAGKLVTVSLSAAEMNADRTVVLFSDAAGAEWQDLEVTIFTDTVQFNGIAAAVWNVLTATLTTAGSIGKYIVDTLAAAAVFPAGAIEFTYTLTSITTGLPIADADIWITTDLAGLNVVWRGTTDAFGIARDVNNGKPWLDAGTYYFFRQRSGYTFSNPDTEVVS